jgi:hypothetical protein
LEPERFEPARLPMSLRSRESALLALRDRLFAGLAEENLKASCDGGIAAVAPVLPGTTALAPLSTWETPSWPAVSPPPGNPV